MALCDCVTVCVSSKTEIQQSEPKNPFSLSLLLVRLARCFAAVRGKQPLPGIGRSCLTVLYSAEIAKKDSWSSCTVIPLCPSRNICIPEKVWNLEAASSSGPTVGFAFRRSSTYSVRRGAELHIQIIIIQQMLLSSTDIYLQNPFV